MPCFFTFKKLIFFLLKMFRLSLKWGTSTVALGLGAYYFLLKEAEAETADDGLHPPHFHWSHTPHLASFDHASLRRGFQVYREVCAACHSLNRVAFRDFVNVLASEEEVKAIAEEYEVADGPDDKGDMFTRPGKVFFHLMLVG